ncbi:MAG: phosphatidylserine decarboxylase family protein [Bacteroidales bacterium]|nr:phosphatidylserine decarboxylase family protein [Bacteroidales bacterium]
MKIHREGYKLISYIFAALAVLNAIIICCLARQKAVWITVLLISLSLAALLIIFFRKPERRVVEDSSKILAAADGRVVAIEEVDEEEYFGDRRLQVSVFMSIFDVHSNTCPVSGTIKYVRHKPGKFFVASLPKASDHNERTSVVIEMADGTEIMIRQIAGTIARRIVTYAREGSWLRQGDELGFIKFGSRVDIFMPRGTKLKVALSQKVHAGRDVLAEI